MALQVLNKQHFSITHDWQVLEICWLVWNLNVAPFKAHSHYLVQCCDHWQKWWPELRQLNPSRRNSFNVKMMQEMHVKLRQMGSSYKNLIKYAVVYFSWGK